MSKRESLRVLNASDKKYGAMLIAIVPNIEFHVMPVRPERRHPGA